MELRGEIRRGYFVEGLSGMQFALPAAVDMLRSIGSERSNANDERVLVVNACDPANPYGLGIDAGGQGSSSGIRISRLPLNHFVFDKGNPILWIESFGSRITTLSETTPEILLESLRQFVEYLRSSHRNKSEIILEFCNGVRPTASPLAEILRSVGFYRDRSQTMRLELR